MKRHIRILLSTAVTSFCFFSCQRVEQIAPQDDGYLVPGSQMADAFGVPVSDTIAERDGRGIPGGVVDAAAQFSEAQNLPAECNRFFPSGNVIIVVTPAFCRTNWGRHTDAMPAVAFRSDGSFIGELSWRGGELHPMMRFALPTVPPDTGTQVPDVQVERRDW